MLDPTKPVQTRDGRSARILCTDRKHPTHPIVAAVQYEGTEMIRCHALGGRFYTQADGPEDIINVPQKRVIYGNVYPDGWGGCYRTRAEADNWASDNRIARIRVEYTDGQFDE